MDKTYIALVVPIVGWLLALLGLYIANKQANSRETRKEYRTTLTTLEVTIDRLLHAFRTYLSEFDAVKGEQARLMVHSELGRIRRQIEFLEPTIGKGLENKFTLMYEAVTGGDFESKSHTGQTDAKDYSRIVTAAENLLECTEGWFKGTYHKE